MAKDVLGKVPKQKKQQTITPDAKSILIDPTNVLNYVGTKSKPGAIGYAVLRSMATRAKPVAAIIQTRLNQVVRYTHRPSYTGDTGFRVVLKDKDKEPTATELRRGKEIEEAILHTGFLPNKKRKDNFDMFLRKIIRDSLVLDAMTFEVVYNRKGDVVEWWAVDGSTIDMVTDQATIHANPVVYQPITKDGKAHEGEIAYVQKYNGNVYAEFTEDELAYAIRNPRTDIRYALFGLSELEILVETVTGLLNSEAYNNAYFSHSNLPQGILEIVGQYEDEHLEAFKRHWEALVSGAVGKWKVPVMALQEGQGLKFTPFKQSAKDMEFHQWLEFLTNVACAVYQVDPAEIGFKSWSGGGGKGVINSEAEASRLDHSQDKGFFPLMQFIANTINSELIDKIESDFVFEWVGLNDQNQDHLDQKRNERLTLGYTTINEERRQDNLPIIEEMLIDAGYDKEQAKLLGQYGDAPANAQLLQIFMQGLQQQMAAQQAEQPGQPGQPGQPPPKEATTHGAREQNQEQELDPEDITKSLQDDYITIDIEWED